MALGTRHRLTVDEFFALPGELVHTELVDGEIVVDSPSVRHQDIGGWTWRRDRTVKKDHYETNGLPELWLVDSVADEIVVHRRSSPDAPTFDVVFTVGADDVLTTPVIPGFTLDVGFLFDR